MHINFRLTVEFTIHLYFLHIYWRIPPRTQKYKFRAKKNSGRCHVRNLLSNFTHYLQCASSVSADSLAQHGKKFDQTTSLSESFLSKYFSICLLRSFFNELKINSNSSSLMPSLLFVFKVKVDYVEGNSRMIIYNNYVEVPQLCMAKKRSTQLVFHLQLLYLF